MKGFVKSFFASVLAIIFVLLLVVAIASMATGRKPEIKDGSYLVIDIYGEILAYYPPDDFIAELVDAEPETLHRILSNLEKVTVDDRIDGVLLKISGNQSLGGAAMQELRAALERVRDAGKPVYAYSDDLNRNGLFIASACDSLFMPLGGNVYLTGFGMTRMFVRGLLDKLDIEPNLHKIDEYKSAAEMVLRKDMSPEAREMMGWIMDDVWDGQLAAIAEGRGITEAQLTQLMEKALFTAPQALDSGVIDGIRYWDELKDGLKDEDDDALRTVSQSAYADTDRASLGLKGKKKVAVIHTHGTIGGRRSRVDPLMGMMIGHETVASDLRRVRKDDDIVAVIVRIDSPGGEALASDLIGHEVEQTGRAKPIVASMIDVAASGGYHIAYKADRVVANPMTITGSIGSITGKMNIRGAYNKLGITYDSFGKGPNGFFYSPFHSFDDEQRKRLEENHWDGFNIWLEDVAARRGIPLDDLREISMGRVWTGNQAVANGLVDDLGGLDHAIAIAKEMADIPEDEEVTIVHYPSKKGLIEMITGGGPKAAVRWLLYRFIRDDLAASVNAFVRSEQVLVPR